VTVHGPQPPSDLHARRLPLRTLALKTVLWRIHDDRWHPIWFGPAEGAGPHGRFDVAAGEFRVCYVGLSAAAAFAETFLRNPGRRVLDRTLLGSRAISTVTNHRPLSLVRLYGPGLARLGATAEVTHGPAYELARTWSLALWSHPAQPDGILYHSRHDDVELCAALFDRVSDDVGHLRSERLLSSPLLRGFLTRYRVILDPRG